MPAMPETLACTPTQTTRSHDGVGAVSGAKKRRRSRAESFSADAASKLDVAVEPLLRKQRHSNLLNESEEADRKEAAASASPCSEDLHADSTTASDTADEDTSAAAAEEPASQEADSDAKEASMLSRLKTIVINLERRPDRMDGCAARLDEECPDLKFERFPAVDGRLTPISTNMVVQRWDTTENVVYQRIRSIRKNWDDLHTYHERTLELSPGERGCGASHVQAWRHCLAHCNDEPLLVLEDDAAPVKDFEGILTRALAALPSDAGVLYLGYSQAAEWRREISPELVESEYVWTTVGYMIWPAAARLLLSKLPINQPVDNWMAHLCAKGELKAYCIRPKIIRQSDAWNCGSDIRHSDENYWGPDSDIIHSEVAPVPVPAAATTSRGVAGAIFDDGSSFWDINEVQQEQIC